MKRLFCKWFGHRNESRVISWIGPYRRNWSFCDRCERWREV